MHAVARSKLECQEESSKDNQVDTLDLNLCHELLEVVESQNILINDYLQHSSTLDLTDAITINGLVIQCDSLVRIMKIEGHEENEPRSFRKNDFAHFLNNLEQLTACLRGISTEMSR